MNRIRQSSFLALVATLSASTLLRGQGAPFGDDFLPAIRRAAALIPGEPAISIRYVTPQPGLPTRLSSMVEGASADTILVVHPVFQVRFDRGWITVDAAMHKSLFGTANVAFSDAKYDSIQVALRDARLCVITHEHHDHIAGILRSRYLAQVAAHTILTHAQIRHATDHPSNRQLTLDPAMSGRFLSIDYDPLMPIAPGVVLIKSPGHTPGSQIIYVRVASGREVILAGDVAWNMTGIRSQSHKPDASTRGFGGEDKPAGARQLKWLNDVQASGITVIASHDRAWIDEAVQRGILQPGFDLRNP